MQQTWRWFGPDDPVSLENVAQAGAAGVVTALHHMNRGEAWSEDEILKRRAEIERAGLVWSVVESIGVGEEIKTRSGDFRQKIDNYKQSIRNAARAGVEGVLLQFHGDHRLEPHQSRLAAAERRHGAAVRRRRLRRLRPLHPRARGGGGRISPARISAAKARFEAMTPEASDSLEQALIDWLPARDFAYDRESFRRALKGYADVGVEEMRQNLIAFVREISEVAEEEGADSPSIRTTRPFRSSACRG